MAENFYSVITKVGQAKISNAIALGQKINFSKMKLGDSNGTYYEPTEEQTDIVNEVYESPISEVVVDEDNPNWIHVKSLIPSNVGGWVVREYGIYDTDDDLIAICKCAETYKPVISDGSIKELLLDMVICVVNTDVIELKVDPTVVIASKKDIIELKTYVNNQLNKFLSDGFMAVTANGTGAYVGSNSDIKQVVSGTKIMLFVNSKSTTNCKLNLNGTGYKTIKDIYGNVIKDMRTNIPYLLVCNGTDWIMQTTSINSTTINNSVTSNTNEINSIKNTLNSMTQIYSGTSEPSSTLGKNGDIYIKY